MKKSLFSLLILSTLSLSTQAIAQQIKIGNTQNIAVSGRVVAASLSCTVQPVSAVQLTNAYIPSFNTTPTKKFSIDFSNCNNPNVPKKVKVVFAAKLTSNLANNSTAPGHTNAQVGLLDPQNRPVLLNGTETDRTFASTVGAANNGKLEFTLKYLQPATPRTPLTPGTFSSTLSFDAYVTDDVQ